MTAAVESKNRGLLVNSRIHRLIAVFLATACCLGAGATQAAIGDRVIAQEWSPLTPDQQSVKVLTDQPSLVSDSVNTSWAKARVQICNFMVSQLGQSGFAMGQTLRGIESMDVLETSCSIENNEIKEYLAHVRIKFRIER